MYVAVAVAVVLRFCLAQLCCDLSRAVLLVKRSPEG